MESPLESALAFRLQCDLRSRLVCALAFRFEVEWLRCEFGSRLTYGSGLA